MSVLKAIDIIRNDYPKATANTHVRSVESVLYKEGYIILTDLQPFKIVTQRSIFKAGHILLCDCIDPLPSVGQETDIETIITIMNQHLTDIMPVSSDNNLIGIILRRDVVKVLNDINYKLNELVSQRTKELQDANEKLISEIEAHKKTIANLQESEKQFRTILEVAPVGFFIHNGYEDVRYVNQFAMSLLGINSGDDLGKRFDSTEKKRRNRSFNSIKTNSLTSRPQETRFIGSDSKIGYMNIVTCPIQYDGNDVLLSVGLEITDLKKMQQEMELVNEKLIFSNKELKKSKEHFVNLADSIADIFFSLNKDFKITFWGKTIEHLSGISAKDAIGKRFDEVFPSNLSINRILRLCHDVIDINKIMRTLYKYQNKHYEVNIYPFGNSVTVIARNISGSRQLKSRYAEYDEGELKKISQTIHNNIGQYLSALSLRCAELEEKVKMQVSINLEDMNGIHNLSILASESLHEFTQSMLWKENKNISDRDILLSLCRNVEMIFGITIKKNIDDSCLPSSILDRGHVIRFIQEALTNAAKHSKKKEVDLWIECRTDHLTYLISDKGSGFNVSAAKKGLGLKLMEFNAYELAAEFDIKSDHKGTNISLKIPK